jgi:pyruvate dehydrogenase E1 component subunit alpha
MPTQARQRRSAPQAPPNQGAAAGDKTADGRPAAEESDGDKTTVGKTVGTRPASARSAASRSTSTRSTSAGSAGARSAAGTRSAGTGAAAGAKPARRPAEKGRAAKRASSESDGQLRAYYRDMLLIRRFEERAARAYTEALIGGYCHLNLGEEAAVVGLMAALKPTDYLFTNYREHGYALMRGIDPNRVMAELYGRVDGVSKGWGGSMHMFDVTHRLLGGYGIVGGQLPLATGAALAVDYRDGDEVVMCTMGDGTAAIGAFHESLNIAALWNLPIVYVIINNGLGMGTTVAKSSAEPDLYKRGAAYRMESARVDGFDPVAVRDAAAKAVEAARHGRPYLLEVISERLRGHSVVDPAKYRTAEEVERLKHEDPIQLFGAKLTADGVLDHDAIAVIEQEVADVVAAAADFAAKSPHPAVSTLFDYTYATPVANDSRRLPGQPLFDPEPLPETATAATQAPITQANVTQLTAARPAPGAHA